MTTKKPKPPHVWKEGMRATIKKPHPWAGYSGVLSEQFTGARQHDVESRA